MMSYYTYSYYEFILMEALLIQIQKTYLWIKKARESAAKMPKMTKPRTDIPTVVLI